MNHPVYEGMNGKGGGFITDFYAAFIFCSTRNSFLDRSLIMIVSWRRLVLERGVENFFFLLPSPSLPPPLLFFPRGKNEVVPDIYTYVTFMVSLWRTVSHGAISDKIKQLGDNLLRRGN